MNDPRPADAHDDAESTAEFELLGLAEPEAAPIPPAEPEPEPRPATDAAPAMQDSALRTRRAEIDAKQEQVAALLAEAGADGVLLLDPANLAWLTGAALGRDIADPAEWPALYLTPTGRWLVCGSTDTQRLFDAHLDGLGFQLKEWPWAWGRERLLNELCQNRRMACDRLLGDCVPLGPTLRRLRCTLTPGEQARLLALGADVSHALEATGRAVEVGQPETEVAGHLAHRLWRRGAQPVALTAAADGRPGRHRRPGVTRATVQHSCVVAATACRDGLHVTASRTVVFGAPDAAFRQDYDAACRILAALAAASVPGTAAGDVLEAGRRVAHLGGHDDAWSEGPPGHVTGWQPVERPIVPNSPLALEAGWAITWQAGVGAAVCGDTFLAAAPPACVTAVEAWPVKRIRVQGLMFDVPDLLVR